MIWAMALLRGIAMVPALVHGVESLMGGRRGGEKKEAVLTMAGAALEIAESVAKGTIADEAGFRSGLGKVVDGVVECMNASVWAKKAA